VEVTKDMWFHRPVLLNKVIQLMDFKRDYGFYCDCTVGGAGHLLAMLRSTRKAQFIGIDWDSEAIGYARKKIALYKNRCSLLEDNFINLGLILDRLEVKTLNGVLFDLGVSYHQLITPHRGFSFDHEGKLLMRMSSKQPTLLEKLEHVRKSELIAVLKQFGDVHSHKKLGNAIFENRKILKTTSDLRTLIEQMTPERFLHKDLHKVFQALRIWVNNELENLRIGLLTALQRLNPQGRIIVISYHSGEDRIVKNMFRKFKKRKELILLHKKVIKPNKAEITDNPRARSAKLRVGEKCVFS
jgi:16S rRNA (cytosine1402-N4)-methyltransferase